MLNHSVCVRSGTHLKIEVYKTSKTIFINEANDMNKYTLLCAMKLNSRCKCNGHKSMTHCKHLSAITDGQGRCYLWETMSFLQTFLIELISFRFQYFLLSSRVFRFKYFSLSLVIKECLMLFFCFGFVVILFRVEISVISLFQRTTNELSTTVVNVKCVCHSYDGRLSYFYQKKITSSYKTTMHTANGRW